MNQDIPSRRLVLRGAVALGCGLCLPIVLSGCDSKPGANPGGAPSSGSPATGINAAAPEATKKVSQASVQYRAQPKGEQKCGNCAHFVTESNTCKLVDGQISPEGWCVAWARKA